MAKYQQYEEYKDSHLNYYGLIPGHWFLEKIKYNSYVKGRQGWQNLRSEEYQDEGPYLVTGAHFDQKGGVSWELCHHISEERYDRDSDIWIEERDVLVTKDGTIGKVAFINNLPYKACLNSHLLIIRNLFNSYDQRFLFHLLSSSCFKGFIPTRQTGTTFMGITQAAIEEFPLLLPPADEQSKIASFLDHETAQIDTLIEKQQTLIQLLKEKRQAVISHAVTKGLNPDAPMKDSGVEWLGEVPEHWEQVKLKHVVDYIIDAEHKTAPYFEQGKYLVCRTTNVRDGELRLEGGKYTNEETYLEWIKRGKPEIGDILFTREAPAGEACVYDGTVPLCLGQRMVLFKLKKDRVLPTFVLHSLYSGLADDFIKQLSQGSTVAHFNMADIRNIPLFEPSLVEQQEIVEYLSKLLNKFDDLVYSAEQAIQLMQERRTALISAAVTGKIDVRGWQSPE